MTSLESITFTRIDLQDVRSRMIDVFAERFGFSIADWPADTQVLYGAVTKLIVDHCAGDEVYTLTPRRGADYQVFAIVSWLREQVDG